LGGSRRGIWDAAVSGAMAVEIRTATARSRWERVDQLRGLAALAVVVCHLAVSAYRQAPNLDGGPWPWLALILGFGYLGVPLFFVISGFCIHLPHARALVRATPAPAAPDWRRFFGRRFWRLYPPYLAALVVAVALWWAAGSEIPWLAVATQALLVHPFHTATFDGVNPPAWTLAVEAQLYLAYPVVFWLMARLGALRALGAVLAVTMAYRVGLVLAPPLPVELAGPAWEVFLARWFEWVLGAVVAEWAAGRLALPRVLSSPWPAGVTLGAAVLLEWYAPYYGLYVLKEPLYGVAFALLLYAALAHERPGLGSAPGRYLAGVGIYSYSLYLLHRPIQLAFEPLAREVATWPGVIAHGVPSSLLIMAATTPLVLWAARVFYRCCEGPSIRRSQAI
jgi:peptidoglycan/LPS O-acetylase OafA/YrhL